jgi:hypothetical protein
MKTLKVHIIYVAHMQSVHNGAWMIGIGVSDVSDSLGLAV